jgi:hypothetical protein
MEFDAFGEQTSMKLICPYCRVEFNWLAGTGAGLPDGFDAFCMGCGDPYTFRNAQACGAQEWLRFCCSYCEAHPVQIPRGVGPYCLSLLRRMRDEEGIQFPKGPGKNRLPLIIGKGLAGWDFKRDRYLLTNKGRALLRFLDERN